MVMFRAVIILYLAVARARELDPAACAARFDVQRNKIIRTEESREMGARYLSELDVGSRHECRRLCCETDACDVFVYEEKSPGSCYLFVCGPPEDFRCKFTAHGNFSSGVLALSRRLAELQDQERLSARPLTPLAPVANAPLIPAAPTHSPAMPAAPHTTSTSTTTLPPPPPRPAATDPPPVPAAPHTSPQPQKSRCSRYQWECHTGGECIAVYNACDGIPQCADGSDEAPELGCPAVPIPPVRHPQVPAPPSPAPVHRPPPPIYPVQMYEQEGGGAESRMPELAGMGADVGLGGAVGAEDPWPHRLLQAQPRRYPSAEAMVPVLADSGGLRGVDGPHIFSHKGGLVQEQGYEPPPQTNWNRHAPHQAPNIESGWGWSHPQLVGAWPEERRPSHTQHVPAPGPPPLLQEQLQMSEFPNSGYIPRPMPELPIGYGSPVVGAPHDAPKKGPPAPPEPPARPEPPPPQPVDNGTKKKSAAIHASNAESLASSKQEPPPPPPVVAPAGGHAQAMGAEAHRDEHDGLSEHPPAAIMLLVLGVCMTGALGAVVGCRARASRRRLRRGKPLAHDADYLVNGMYL